MAGSSIGVRETCRVLGGPRVLKRRVETVHDLRRAVREGLPAATVRQVASAIVRETSGAPFARFIGGITSLSTWKRRVREGRLSTEESERTERVARVFATAVHVLGNDDLARRFMDAPHLELEGRPPIDVVTEELGARQIEDILWGIYFGLPA
jgi:putative toxin-antitoxin system antitoxin component (TIGR02293 family)